MLEIEAASFAPPPPILLEPAVLLPMVAPVPDHPSASLGLAFERLSIRFALPFLDLHEESPAGRELRALERAGLGAAAYLACLCGCALRCTIGGAPLAFGAWAGSSLLAQYGLSLFADPDDRRWRAFGDRTDDGTAGLPRLLVPRLPAPDALAALASAASGRDVSCAVVGAVLRVSLDAGEALLEVLPSRLAEALLLAQLAVERRDGVWPDGTSIARSDGAAATLLGSGWLRLVPELPPWFAAPVECDGVESLIDHAVAAAPGEVGPTAAGALRCRAEVVWALAAIAVRYPHAGWVALLSVADPSSVGAAAAAARDAGVELLPPDVSASSVAWSLVDAADGQIALRAGLASLVGAEIARLIVVGRASGPYASLSELVRRVPALAARPLPLARLIAAGALDRLHDRGALIAGWDAIAEYGDLLVLGDADTPEPSFDGEPPPSAEIVAAWSRALAPLESSLFEVAATASTLPAADAPADGPVPVAGVVLARRECDEDGRPLAILEVGDGSGSISLILEAAEAPVRVGHWIAREVLLVRQGGRAIGVAPALAAPHVPRAIAVLVPRLGDREGDLARMMQVRDILRRHPGTNPVRLFLLHGDRRRLLDLGEPLAAAWSPALAAALEGVLGPGAAELAPAQDAAAPAS